VYQQVFFENVEKRGGDIQPGGKPGNRKEDAVNVQVPLQVGAYLPQRRMFGQLPTGGSQRAFFLPSSTAGPSVTSGGVSYFCDWSALSSNPICIYSLRCQAELIEELAVYLEVARSSELLDLVFRKRF
jgi:hypothetical protein